MPITLKKDIEQRLLASIRRFLTEQYEQEVGDLQATLFLRFCLAELGPAIYNQAIADAQAFMQERAADLENVCFADEGSFWKKEPGRKPAMMRRPSRA